MEREGGHAYRVRCNVSALDETLATGDKERTHVAMRGAVHYFVELCCEQALLHQVTVERGKASAATHSRSRPRHRPLVTTATIHGRTVPELRSANTQC